MVTLEQIREQLKIAIKQSGYRQSDIAKKIGVHHSAIGQYLSGRAMPALDTFANLCDVLDLDANEILCIDEHSPDSKRTTVNNSFNGSNISGNIKF